MTQGETARILAALSAVWPERFAPERGVDPRSTARAYHLAWADLEYETMRAAAAEWIRRERWFPRPAELREALGVRPRREDWGLGRCERCDRPAGMRDRGMRACWGHVDAVFGAELVAG